MYKFIQYEIENNVATLWLNRPEKRNCINWEMLNEMAEAIKKAEEDDDVRALVVRGRGGTFCAGADLDMLDADFLQTTVSSMNIATFSAKTYDRLYNMKKPTIAVVEGYAVAGGFELLISCDFVVAAEDAKIGDFHIRRALFGGAGPIYRLPRYVGMRRAKELMLTGKLLSGTECAEWGLVNAAGPSENLDQLLEEFLEPLVDKSPFVMWITKMAANRGLDADTETLMVLEHLACNVVHQSQDAKEGVQAFLNKRQPAWTGN
jgi:enoyl-CoA hydratase